MEIHPTLLTTADGSHTLIHPLLGDSYHSVNGAAAESKHVFIDAGFSACEEPNPRIFEVGFGSGLNALMTLQEAENEGRSVVYHAVELYPVAADTVSQLNYAADDRQRQLFDTLHASEWGVEVEICPSFRLKKIANSLLNTEIDGIFNLIYFDAFAPDTQPEMWSEEVFRRLYSHTAAGGMLLTYSAKGDVKRALRAAGYEAHRLAGALGKRHMLRAIKV